MTGRRWRLAIAGCGGAAFGIHLPILTGHPDFEVVAVGDRDRARAQSAAAVFAVPRVAADTAELLVGADMLVVLTPVHEPLIEAGLRAGLHVFTEKPVSLDIERTRALRQHAARVGLLLEVGAMRAHDPAVHALLQVVRPGQAHGGWLVKLDGLDAQTRQAFLPNGFAPYTFDDNTAPAVPAGLGALGRGALEILLWQGYHLLTVLTLAAIQPHSLSCVLAQPGPLVHATVAGAGGSVFSMLIGAAPVGVHLEEVVLLGSHAAAGVTFGPPYGPGNPAHLSVHGAAQSSLGKFANPFRCMWSRIGARLRGLPETDSAPHSAALAETIEQLAAELATAAVPATPQARTREAGQAP